MTDAERQPRSSLSAPVRGFAALGTDDLHAPPLPAEPTAPADDPVARRPSDEKTPPGTTSNGGEVLVALVAGSVSGMLDAELYQRILGDELRKLRRRRGWTRKELNAHLQSEISLQTLATYELGTRQCSVVRLVELCVAMDELPQALIAKVHRRVVVDEPGHVRADLRALAVIDDPHLAPLRRWAEDRLRQPGADTEVQLDLAALGRMAELCDLPPTDLIVVLRDLSD